MLVIVAWLCVCFKCDGDQTLRFLLQPKNCACLQSFNVLTGASLLPSLHAVNEGSSDG